MYKYRLYLLVMNITLRQLQIVDAIVHTGSYSLAAEHLHMTQPAISMQMKQLEHITGLKLFERHGKRIVLTSAGEDIHKFSCQIIARYNDMQETILSIKDSQSGRIKVSAATTANHLITQMIADFSKIHSGISVALDITNREQLLQQLIAFEPDIVIMGEPPPRLELVSEQLIPNPLVVIAHAEHELVDEPDVQFATIAEHEFVVREVGSGTRAAIERFFIEQDAVFKSTLEMGSNEAIKNAVIAGLGLGIVSLHSIKLELEANKLHILNVEGFPIIRHWHIVRSKGKYLLPAAREFMDFIIHEARIYAKDYNRFQK